MRLNFQAMKIIESRRQQVIAMQQQTAAAEAEYMALLTSYGVPPNATIEDNGTVTIPAPQDSFAPPPPRPQPAEQPEHLPGVLPEEEETDAPAN